MVLLLFIIYHAFVVSIQSISGLADFIEKKHLLTIYQKNILLPQDSLNICAAPLKVLMKPNVYSTESKQLHLARFRLSQGVDVLLRVWSLELHPVIV